MASKRRKKGKAAEPTTDEKTSIVEPLGHVPAPEVPRKAYVAPVLTSSAPPPASSLTVAPSQFAMNEDPACGDGPGGEVDE